MTKIKPAAPYSVEYFIFHLESTKLLSELIKTVSATTYKLDNAELVQGSKKIPRSLVDLVVRTCFYDVMSIF